MYILFIFCLFPLIFGKKIALDSIEDIIENNEQVLKELNKNISSFGDRIQRFVDLDSLSTNFSEHEDIINKLNLSDILATEPTTKKIEPTTKKIELTTKKIEPTTKKIELSTKKIEPTTKKIEISTKKIEPTTKKIEISTKKIEPTTNKPINESKLKIALWRIFIILFGLTVAPMCIAVLIFIVIKIKDFISERRYFVNDIPL